MLHMNNSAPQKSEHSTDPLSATAKSHVYFYGSDQEKMDSKLVTKESFGGKGFGLVNMTLQGHPVPPGFIISTSAYPEYNKNNSVPPSIIEEIKASLVKLEKSTKTKFGDSDRPLIVSTRSTAEISMPGMMETVLNVGVNDNTVKALIKENGEVFAYDTYLRSIESFATTVLGIDEQRFIEVKERLFNENTASTEKKADPCATKSHDFKPDAATLKRLIAEYKNIAPAYPQDVNQQLEQSIAAVFASWNNKRTKAYRRSKDISDDIGTAVAIVSMVFGNKSDRSCSGVLFSRDPNTGENKPYGEFLLNSQGSDIVSGSKTPYKISKQNERDEGRDGNKSMEACFPESYRELIQISKQLEKSSKHVQDIEFTIEDGKLFILQTRNAMCTAQSEMRTSVEMMREGIISEEEAMMQLDPDHITQLLFPQFDEKSLQNNQHKMLVRGVKAAPGAAVGQIICSKEKLDELKKKNPNGQYILVVPKVGADDSGLVAMEEVKGVLSKTGGSTSHASIIAGGAGKPCVCGAAEIQFNKSSTGFSINGHFFNEGDVISLDGGSGKVYGGAIEVIEPDLKQNEYFRDFMKIVDKLSKMTWQDANGKTKRPLKVLTNAETPSSARKSLDFGADGIGCARSENMISNNFNRQLCLQKYIILSERNTPDTVEERNELLEQLKAYQLQSFQKILTIMHDKEVVIRLLDPTFNELIPGAEEEDKIQILADNLSLDSDLVKKSIRNLQQSDPMFGLRGVRLAMTTDAGRELYRIQCEAIREAKQLSESFGLKVHPKIQIPLVSAPREMQIMRERVKKIIGDSDIPIGCHIETQSACIDADKIAKNSDFFCFGTNDLTQGTNGWARNDLAKGAEEYIKLGIFTRDPFKSVVYYGNNKISPVQASMSLCVTRGRSTKPDLDIGIAGEQGGEKETIKFCTEIGMHHTSVSPFKILSTRLAAVQAAILEKNKLKGMGKVMNSANNNINPNIRITAEEMVMQMASGDINKQNTLIFDASWNKNPEKHAQCKQSFQERRIDGAAYFDIQEVRDKTSGLPRTLLDAKSFKSHMEQLGVDPSKKIIVYADGKTGLDKHYGSCRVWWMLKTMGYPNVQVLDGGLSAYKAELNNNPDAANAYAIDTNAPTAPSPITIDMDFQRDDSRYFAFEQINSSNSKNIIDSRSKARFESEKEGHIAGSKNIPGTSLVTEDGYLVGKHVYQHLLNSKGIKGGQSVVGSCGSGTTASVHAFLHELHTGDKMKVYDGSISEYLVKADPKDIEKGKATELGPNLS